MSTSIPSSVTDVCEERDDDETTVLRRAFAQGEEIGGSAHYFTTDHLGSVREVTDGSETELAEYVSDPWGQRTLTTGANVTTVGFTAHRWHQVGASWFTQYRLLDSATGRWSSEDPMGAQGGPNLYAYVNNNPVNGIDRFGLLMTPGVKRPPSPPSGTSRSLPPGCPPTNETCSAYPEDSWGGRLMRTICLNTPDGPWSNCVRSCLQKKYEDCSTFSCIVTDHLTCWSSCPSPSRVFV